MATVSPAAQGRLSFWQKMAIGLALFIVFGFVQFTLRGFVDVARVPAYVHVHALAMIAWLGVTVLQPTLAERADTTLHRRVGWFGVTMATAVVIIGIYTARHVLAAERQPPFFTPPYFLALTHIGLAFFAGMVIAAVLVRKDTAWHRRLMVGSTVMLMEPALGRLLPMPLLMPWGESAVLVLQLLTMVFVVGHDRRTVGRIHPATLTVMGLLVINYLLVEAVARSDLAARIVSGLTGQMA